MTTCETCYYIDRKKYEFPCWGCLKSNRYVPNDYKKNKNEEVGDWIPSKHSNAYVKGCNEKY